MGKTHADDGGLKRNASAPNYNPVTGEYGPAPVAGSAGSHGQNGPRKLAGLASGVFDRGMAGYAADNQPHGQTNPSDFSVAPTPAVDLGQPEDPQSYFRKRFRPFFGDMSGGGAGGY